MLDKLLEVSLLFDFYGGLLTERQRRCLELHFAEDLSLSEIAEQLEVSRQAVYDMSRRAEQLLYRYEEKLGLAARYQLLHKSVVLVSQELAALPEDIRRREDIKKISADLAAVVGQVEED